MDKGDSIVGTILEILSDFAEMLPRPLETPYAHMRRMRRVTYKQYYDAVYHLKRRGLVKIENKQGKNYVQLTKEGVLETLLAKADVHKTRDWDGKWRICIFDIPENAHLVRDHLRWLLKRYGFRKLQASVFVSPYSLNREALAYLKESGLDLYIKFMKVEEMDDDAALRKDFNVYL